MEKFFQKCIDTKYNSNKNDMDILKTMCEYGQKIYLLRIGATNNLIILKNSDGFYVELFSSKNMAEEKALKYNGAVFATEFFDAPKRLSKLFFMGCDFVRVYYDDIGIGFVDLKIDKEACEELCYKKSGCSRSPELSKITLLYKTSILKGNPDDDLAESAYEIAKDKTLNILALENGNPAILTKEELKEVGLNRGEDALFAYSEQDTFADGVYATLKGEKGLRTRAFEMKDILEYGALILVDDCIVVDNKKSEKEFLKTQEAKRAIAYTRKKNVENGIEIDAVDLLERLYKYPEMYNNFINGIDDELQWVGKIKERIQGKPGTAGYSGAAIYETLAEENAAATYSILEKLMTNPDRYMRIFEAGQLLY